MTNQQKSNQQLAAELADMRRRVTELESKLANKQTTAKFTAPTIMDFSSDLLQRLIQQLPIGVQMFDKNGVCTSVNKAQMEIFGLSSSKQVVGQFNLCPG